MAVNLKKQKYDIEYAKNNLKRVPLDLKIEKYNKIKAHAEQRGESVNGFIKRAIDETMERDGDYAVLSGTAEISENRIDRFTSDAGDFEIVRPAPKKNEKSNTTE